MYDGSTASLKDLLWQKNQSIKIFYLIGTELIGVLI